MNNLRPDNQALEYLLVNYSDRGEKFAQVLRCLIALAEGLMDSALGFTAQIMVKSGVRGAAIGTVSEKCDALAKCVFDLMLLSCFSQIGEYTGDSEFTSVFVDALLYQATGCEAEVPTKSQILDEGTHHTRGVAKYKVARDYIKISELDGWLFGKEYASVVSGNPKELALIMAVGPISFLIRADAMWSVKYFLYGTSPSDEEREQIKAIADKLSAGTAEVFAQLSSDSAKQR